MIARPIYRERVPGRVHWGHLCRNPNPRVIPILEDNPHQIDFTELSKNPNATYLLRQNLHRVNWNFVSRNPGAFPLIRQNPDRVVWNYISQNPSLDAMALLEQNPDKIEWTGLSGNPSAIGILERHLQKINWLALSENPSAISLLERNPKRIKWLALSSNPNAISLIKANWNLYQYDKFLMFYLCLNPNSAELFETENNLMNNLMSFDWYNICRNSKSIRFLEKNIDLIRKDIGIGALTANKKPEMAPLLERNLYRLGELTEFQSHLPWAQNNPDLKAWGNLSDKEYALDWLFGYDYGAMQETNQEFAEELMRWVLNPVWMGRMASQYGMCDLEEYLDMI